MPRNPAIARPDPSSRWVIDTRELGRRPGSMRCYRRTIPVPAGLGLDVVGIPEGEQLTVDVRLESVMEGVLVSGTAAAPVVGECARCLDPLVDRLEVKLTELFAYPDTATEASTDPDEVSRVVDDRVDLEALVRDAVLLALPQVPLCRDTCPGLCPECGGKRAELGAQHRHEKMDPRWAALERFSGGERRQQQEENE